MPPKITNWVLFFSNFLGRSPKPPLGRGGTAHPYLGASCFAYINPTVHPLLAGIMFVIARFTWSINLKMIITVCIIVSYLCLTGAWRFIPSSHPQIHLQTLQRGQRWEGCQPASQDGSPCWSEEWKPQAEQGNRSIRKLQAGRKEGREEAQEEGSSKET